MRPSWRLLPLLLLHVACTVATPPIALDVSGTTACYELDQRHCLPAATVYAKLPPDGYVSQNFTVDGGDGPDWPLVLQLERLDSELSYTPRTSAQPDARSISCGQEATMYQAYELYEFDYACALGLQVRLNIGSVSTQWLPVR